MIISNASIKLTPIAHVFSQNNDVFIDHFDGEYLSLATFVLYEMLKGNKSIRNQFSGKDSFWYPYFQIVNDSDLICFWSDEELEEFQDQPLIRESKAYSKEMEQEAKLMTLVLSKYPEFFPPEK
jgi:hypothetical protein